ncbi:putative c6 finger domain protein [Neofusicoccum parvum UCRNP2]|uniref:Putative c6 finger domain protein n=1 Tax=Botryosphaeria parva (strain UCR-NP2) TaxID=1287680 RepID=R1FWF5_BOTPV|nr:putative c6 finger domain protein [Neofusicoccum parvum UCRNP2]
MDHGAHHDPSSSTATMTEQLKRKRSPSHDAAAQAPPAPPPKTAKTSNHLQINYLARQYTEDLPLISGDDTLPNILQLLGEYQGVLDRHESMACNLGARPLGPILIKRFERLFDGPPKVLKSHGKDPANVTWLDVVEFARNKPEQFTLGQMSEGVRVCQFYTKQCRVQISEEDYVLISSGIPQKMIPPQPIVEDEEKELGTLEILEKNLAQICQLADQGLLLLAQPFAAV